ncbi:hypothetical protein AAC387_Pa09g1548 [Persea americana]
MAHECQRLPDERPPLKIIHFPSSTFASSLIPDSHIYTFQRINHTLLSALETEESENPSAPLQKSSGNYRDFRQFETYKAFSGRNSGIPLRIRPENLCFQLI